MAGALFIIPEEADKSSLVMCPNIGIAYIAAYLMERGVKVKVLDLLVEEMDDEGIRKLVASYSPDFAFISAYTTQISRADELAGIVKSVDGKITTVIGGYHATGAPKGTLEEFGNFDILVHGEGEKTCQELIEAVGSGKPLSGVKGISHRHEGKVVVNPPRERIADLDSLPFPAYGIFPLDKYANRNYFFTGKARFRLPLTIGRGCPYQCVFCSRPLGNKVRSFSPQRAAEEVRRAVEEFGATQILMTDETFTMDREAVMEFCSIIIEKGLNRRMNWICESRSDRVDREILLRMREAGCFHITYGVESGNPEILKGIKKGITLEQAKDAIRITKEAGLIAQANFILGHPHETRETIMDTINFAVECDPDYAVFSILTPFPGSEITEMAEKGKAGLRLMSRDWKRYSKHLGSALFLEGVSRKELESLHTRAYMRFYLRPRKIRAMLRFLDRRLILGLLAHRIGGKK